MASTGRSRGPASRPPRRPAAARPAGATGTGRSATGKAAGSTSRGASPVGRTGSRPATGAGTTRTSTTAATGRGATASATTARRVVERGRGRWLGRVGGAATHRFARRGVILLSIGVFLVLLLGSTVAAWLHQRSEIAALREQVATQERDVAALQAEQERWTDPAYVEQQARQRLKFVKPGEKSYTVLDPAPRTSADLSGTDVVQPNAALPWYETVWESARTADAPGAHR